MIVPFTYENYENTANELVDRILKLIPKNPQILEITDVFKLFKISGFKCDDLDPTLYQAQWALAKAKSIWKEGKR